LAFEGGPVYLLGNLSIKRELSREKIQEVQMKKPWLAAVLSFLIVGLGLGYLGKWGWAAANFFGVIAVALIVNRFSPDSLSWVGPALGAASASIAFQAAKAMNQKAQTQAAQPQS
jgi:hypothetical protein